MDRHQSGETGSGLELHTDACGRGKLARIAAFKIAKWPQMWKETLCILKYYDVNNSFMFSG